MKITGTEYWSDNDRKWRHEQTIVELSKEDVRRLLRVGAINGGGVTVRAYEGGGVPDGDDAG